MYAARIIFFSPSCLDRFTSDRCNIAFKEREELFTSFIIMGYFTGFIMGQIHPVEIVLILGNKFGYKPTFKKNSICG